MSLLVSIAILVKSSQTFLYFSVAGSLVHMISWIERRLFFPSQFIWWWSINTEKSVSRYHCIDMYYLFLEFEYKIVATSVWFPLRRLRRKVSRAKGNGYLQILEYSTLRPKLKNQIWISNFVGAKLSCWHLRINYFWRQLGSSLELSLWNLGITSFWRQLGSSLGMEIPGDSSR